MCGWIFCQPLSAEGRISLFRDILISADDNVIIRNTPISIPQASLQTWQLPGQIGELQSVYSVSLIYF